MIEFCSSGQNLNDLMISFFQIAEKTKGDLKCDCHEKNVAMRSYPRYFDMLSKRELPGPAIVELVALLEEVPCRASC